jgi:hypothetical protein
MIHARLDPETERMLRRLERYFGWSDSEEVREAIRVLNGMTVRGRRRVVGQGRLSSGIPDLGSKKSRLKRFGR